MGRFLSVVSQFHRSLSDISTSKAYQHFLDDCSQTLDRHEFTDVFQCFSDTISADAAFHALHPRKGKLDGNTIFGAVVATSNQTFISKVSLIYSIYDMDGDGALNKARDLGLGRSLFARKQLENRCTLDRHLDSTVNYIGARSTSLAIVGWGFRVSLHSSLCIMSRRCPVIPEHYI